MAKVTKLPMTLNDTYYEPKSWTMSKGDAQVCRITKEQLAAADCMGCTWVAFNSQDYPIAIFRHIAIAFTFLAEKGYNAVFITHE